MDNVDTFLASTSQVLGRAREIYAAAPKCDGMLCLSNEKAMCIDHALAEAQEVKKANTPIHDIVNMWFHAYHGMGSMEYHFKHSKDEVLIALDAMILEVTPAATYMTGFATSPEPPQPSA